VSVIQDTQEAEIRRIASLGKMKAGPYLKNTQYKKKNCQRGSNDGMCLPSKGEALSSNSSTTKKKSDFIQAEMSIVYFKLISKVSG
jgi:hypothetical protein